MSEEEEKQHEEDVQLALEKAGKIIGSSRGFILGTISVTGEVETITSTSQYLDTLALSRLTETMKDELESMLNG